MNQPKPIPKIRYSMRNAFKRCPRLVYFDYVAGIKPKSRSSALSIGSAFHEGLDKWRSGMTPADAITHAVNHLYDAMNENSDKDTTKIECARLQAYLTGYMRHYADDMKGEFESEMKLETAIEEGTADAIWTDPVDGSKWLVEDKTRTQLTPNLDWVLRMNEQLLSYVILLKENGIDVVGCIYRESKKTQTRPAKAKKETVSQYCQRVIDIYNGNTDALYVECRVAFSQSEIDKYAMEKEHMNGALSMCLQQMHDFDQWGFNSETCVGKYGLCKYTQLCATRDDSVGEMFQPNHEIEPLDGGAFQKKIWGYIPAKPVVEEQSNIEEIES